MSFLINPFYSGTPIGTWQTLFSLTLTSDSTNGFHGSNLRNGLATSAYNSITGTPSKIRLTLEGSTVEGVQITGLGFGNSSGSTASDVFGGNQIQVTKSSSSSFLVPQSGSLVTDEMTYAFDPTKAVVWSFFIANGDTANDTFRRKVSTGLSLLLDVTGTPDSDRSTQTANTGFSAGFGDTCCLVNKIEVFA